MHNQELLDALRLVLKTIERWPSDPVKMFKPIEPLCRGLGLERAAIYFDDVYPDRMRLAFSYGDHLRFPTHIVQEEGRPLLDVFRNQCADIPGLVSARLRSHGHELGIFAGIMKKGVAIPDELDILIHFLSLMAFVERGRRNYQLERQERDIFFAQALASRVLFTPTPRIPNLRLDVHFIRSLESSGDFYDFMSSGRSGLFGMIGCCNGRGLRTTLEMTSIIREIHRTRETRRNLSDILLRVNDLLVLERRRAHQASICLFEIDAGRRRLHLAKAGRLGILLVGRKTGVKNISASGGLFLGLMENPAIQDETFDFLPGQALLCVTEGFYSTRDKGKAEPQLRWLLQTVENTLEFMDYEKDSLATAMAVNLETAVKHSPESMLTLSVEFLDRGRSGCAGGKAATGKRNVRIKENCP
ncbi:MAG: serine/threonine-protein phosphatase [Planctomycetota bacterium]|jgi:serine phosphatase RsbU (regulator of sigma subunit)|nr:serine/threonine-protein phosphatase [Planctomycetota bacterium]